MTSVTRPLRPRASENARRACTSSKIALGFLSKKTVNITTNGANTTIGCKINTVSVNIDCKHNLELRLCRLILYTQSSDAGM